MANQGSLVVLALKFVFAPYFKFKFQKGYLFKCRFLFLLLRVKIGPILSRMDLPAKLLRCKKCRKIMIRKVLFGHFSAKIAVFGPFFAIFQYIQMYICI